MSKVFLEASHPAFSYNAPLEAVGCKETLGAAVDKTVVAKAFSQAAATYNKQAEVQQRISSHLLTLLKNGLAQAKMLEPNNNLEASRKFIGGASVVIDLGAGTGFSLPQLQVLTKTKEVIALDLSKAMLSAIPESSSVLSMVADFDSLPLAENTADVIFSSMSMQWSNDLARLVDRLSVVLKSGGVLAFATLLEGSLPEIDDAWRKVDGSKRSLAHPSHAQWKAWVDSIAVPLSFEQRTEVQHFSNVQQLLKSVRDIGAGDHRQNREKAFLGKRNYQAFLEALSSTAWDESTRSFKLSYSVLYAVLRNNKTA